MAALASGCDLQENADLDNGRQLFIENCGTCHYLKEAGTSGNLGPDLDAAFANARAEGMDQDTIEGVVADQISHPRYTDPSDPSYMPAELVTGQDAEDVSAYVGSVAGVPGIEPPTAPGGPGGQVFANNGCGSCHTFAAAESQGAVGPNLDEGLQGQSKAMIEESIVDPNKEITQGFQPNIMPDNYQSTIEAKDLQLLVDFLYDNAGKPQKQK
ncbi:MAG: c-type cytochrome [Solirubrobacterales bacterium]|nr:c-type cytochrome [Solirubrobacterales bacterium]